MQMLTDANFAEETAMGLVLVDFFAEWCGPCKMLAPVLDQLEPQFEGKIKFFKVDVDQASETSQQYGITSVPTLYIMKDGEVVDKMTGFQTADALTAKLNQHLG